MHLRSPRIGRATGRLCEDGTAQGRQRAQAAISQDWMDGTGTVRRGGGKDQGIVRVAVGVSYAAPSRTRP